MQDNNFHAFLVFHSVKRFGSSFEEQCNMITDCADMIEILLKATLSLNTTTTRMRKFPSFRRKLMIFDLLTPPRGHKFVHRVKI